MKKILILTALIFTLTIIFLACSEERDHANPVDPKYWDSDKTPSNLTVEFVNLTTARLTWTDNSIEDEFIIERKLSSGTTWGKVGEVAGDDKTGVKKEYTDSSLATGLIYSYRVYAVMKDFISNMLYSLNDSSTLPAPSNLTATVIPEASIKLEWSYSTTGIDGFKIDRKIGAGDSWVVSYSTVNTNTKIFTDTGLTTGTTYYYRVRAYYSTYYSSYTGEVNAVPQPPAGFVSIPTGSFSMGQTDVATPVHTVNITRQYYLGKYEVTQKEWQTTMASNPASGYGVGENYPVYNVSWYATLVYCNKRSIAEGLTPCYTINGSTNPAVWGSVPTSSNSTWDAVICNFSANGYRLPTEAEWEYAARYNDGRTYPWGETAPSRTLCNYNSNVGATTSVGSYASGNSNLGLCDMGGNVSELVWDWYSSSYYSSSPSDDPPGPTTAQTYRVLRGGGWYENSYYIRCAYRYSYFPNFGYRYIGFRLARTK